MLTVKQPPSYGYKSVHDLPTPPSTSRLSPPLIYQEPATKSLPVAYRGHTSPSQPMSAPHRGLPPPAAMALPPQQPTTVGVPPPPPPHHQPLPPQPLPQQPQQQPSLGPLVHQQRDRGQLPAPPQQWQGAEESMKLWLQARTEEDRTRQEEERTRQESLRLEQRRVEMDMLRTSIQAGIPPPMVPLVFAGMGAGGLPPHTALEWAQQFMPPGQVLPHAQTTSAQWPLPPEHQRESQSQPHTQQQGIPSASTQAAGYAYPPSPSRPRGQTVSGIIGRPMVIKPGHIDIPNVPQLAHAHAMHQNMQQAQQQHEPQAGSSIYFHHWQPPNTQAGGSSNRPGSPSGETPRKRKATGHALSPTRSEQQYRSPPSFNQGSSSNAPYRGPSQGHSRQRSDMSPFRVTGPGRSRRESFGGPLRRRSPIRRSPIRRSPVPTPMSQQERPGNEHSDSRQSVSAILSEEPQPAGQYPGPTRSGDESGSQYRQRSPDDPKTLENITETPKSRDSAGDR
ncbi:hypothetical protein SNK03_012026 [Fusarium graminearum]